MVIPAFLKNYDAEERVRTLDAEMRARLREDEKILRVARISRGIYWKGVVMLLLGIAMLPTGMANLGIFFLIVAAIALTIEYLTQHYLLLVLTEKRVMIRYGVIQLDVIEMRFNRIESVELEYPPVGRILGYARVVITGTGSRTTIVPYVEVADAARFRTELDDLISGEGVTQ